MVQLVCQGSPPKTGPLPAIWAIGIYSPQFLGKLSIYPHTSRWHSALTRHVGDTRQNMFSEFENKNQNSRGETGRGDSTRHAISLCLPSHGVWEVEDASPEGRDWIPVGLSPLKEGLGRVASIAPVVSCSVASDDRLPPEWQWRKDPAQRISPASQRTFSVWTLKSVAVELNLCWKLWIEVSKNSVSHLQRKSSLKQFSKQFSLLQVS